LNEARKIPDHEAVIGIGSNISPQENIRSALYLLDRMVEIRSLSQVWKTPAVGSPGPDFLNAAALITTSFSLKDLRNEILRPIENLLGRVRTQDPNSPRTIDLDTLIFEGEQLDAELWEYAHMAVPVAELLPDYIDPISGQRAGTIAARMLDSSPIEKSGLYFHWASAS
jgi:2-amino-4-hydroxy-6-hydroxymethyldihydropteridine diphosphokinase